MPDSDPTRLVRTVTVDAPVEVAFRVFVEQFDQVKPREHNLLGAPVVVLQDLLRGVRDRVVVAVTFLALLELMKRREIVVEQAEPWGPITARRMTAAERAAAGPVSVDEDTPLDESLESFA